MCGLNVRLLSFNFLNMNMYVYMYVYLYVCMYVCMYVYTYEFYIISWH